MLNTYDITCSRTGTVRIQANSPKEAMDKADAMDTKDIQWNDDFIVIDYEEADPFGTQK